MNAATPRRTLPIVLVAAAVALLVAWLLGRGLLPPGFGADPADPAEFFTPGQIETAETFRGRIRLISLISLSVGLVALAVMAFYRGVPVDRILTRFANRPVIGGAFLGGFLAALLALVEVPFTLAAWGTGREFGIVTSSPLRLFSDIAISASISIVLFAAAGALAVFAWDRFGRWFWVAASFAIGVFAIAWLWLWPIVVAPLFNDFEPLPEGPARVELEKIADRAGIEIAGVYTVDASKRTSAINAWVHGLGPSRRLVLQDTAIDGLDRAELSSLVAHELAHVESRDPERGLLYVLLTVPLAALAIQTGASRILRRRDRADGGAVVVLPLALGVGLAVVVLSIPGAWLSRQIEVAADARALELTGNGQAMISLQQRVAEENLSEPSRPEPFRTLFATHPDPVERIGMAQAFEMRHGTKPDPNRSTGRGSR